MTCSMQTHDLKSMHDVQSSDQYYSATMDAAEMYDDDDDDDMSSNLI
jgi:hypothetical protein